MWVEQTASGGVRQVYASVFRSRCQGLNAPCHLTAKMSQRQLYAQYASHDKAGVFLQTDIVPQQQLMLLHNNWYTVEKIED